MKTWTGYAAGALRQRAGMTTYRFAERLGVSQPYIIKLERIPYRLRDKMNRRHDRLEA